MKDLSIYRRLLFVGGSIYLLMAGGEISVESEVGKDSAFTAKFPMYR